MYSMFREQFQAAVEHALMSAGMEYGPIADRLRQVAAKNDYTAVHAFVAHGGYLCPVEAAGVRRELFSMRGRHQYAWRFINAFDDAVCCILGDPYAIGPVRIA